MTTLPTPLIWPSSSLVSLPGRGPSAAVRFIEMGLHFELGDLSYFHRLTYQTLTTQFAELDARSKQLGETFAEQHSGGGDGGEVIASRYRESLSAQDLAMENVKNMADQFVVMRLAVLQEANLKNVLRHYVEGADPTDMDWRDLKRGFRGLGIELPSLGRYQDANELRVLYNCIKHSGYVNDKLAEFSVFGGREGDDLSKVHQFEIQRYAEGSYLVMDQVFSALNKD